MLGAAVHAAVPSAKDIKAAQATFQSYCVSCHNTEDWAGGLALDEVNVARIGDQAEIGEKIVAKLRAGLMPPHGKKRPERAEALRVVGTLESALDAAAAHRPPHVAAPGVHRLNRQEYANAIEDLLGLEIDPAALLPVDDSSFGFDNMAGSLGSSPALVSAYVSAASKISRLALGLETEPKLVNYQAPPDYSQRRHVEGMPFGSRGGLLVEHDFPATGDYVFNWTPVRTNAGGIFGNTTGEKLELSIDGRRVKLYDIDKEVDRNSQRDRHDVRVRVEAGPHTVALTFLSLTDAPNDDLNAHFERTTLTQNLDGFSFSPHVNSLSINGPFAVTAPSDTPTSRKIVFCHPVRPEEEEPCARRILGALAHRAFRRPITNDDLRTLMSLYRSGRAAGGNFMSGVQLGLQMVLSDPSFIYRSEPPPAEARAEIPFPVTDLELASRLSFFLWSSIPDDELLDLATSGRLHEPRVLEREVYRMLADARSQRLIHNFAGQWLQLRNLSAAAPVADIFPDFDDNLREDMRTEVEMLVASLLTENRSVRTLLDANYTFLNERLARHYGIPNVYGSQFRRVVLPPEFDARRGLLGKAAILTLTSNADRTSTIRRGQWIDINILGVRPPDPPPNVPGLAAQETHAGSRGQTLRQRMTAHAVNPACAACHQMMDPLGFALEGFDGIGKVRTTDAGQKLDLSGSLVDGTRFEGASQLRQALMQYAPEFVLTLTQRLLTYALGRGVEYADMPTVRAIVREADRQDDRLSAIIVAIVKSEPFLKSELTPASVTADIGAPAGALTGNAQGRQQRGHP